MECNCITPIKGHVETLDSKFWNTLHGWDFHVSPFPHTTVKTSSALCNLGPGLKKADFTFPVSHVLN